MEYITLSFLFVSLVLRIFPIYKFKNLLGTDRLFHFYYVYAIKRNNNKIPPSEDRVIGGINLFNYPGLYHLILSFLPNSFLLFWDKFSGLIFDVLTALLVYIIAVKFNVIAFEWNTLLLSISLYIISPTLTLIYSGPRAYVLTPRNFSQFIFALLILILLLFVSESLSFIIGAVLITILILSSWFSVQVIFLFAPLYTLLAFDFSLMGSLLISGIFLLLFLKDFTFRTVGGGLTHLLYSYDIGRGALAYRSDWRKIYSLFKTMDIKKFFYEVCFSNAITSGVFRNFVVFFFTYYFIINNKLNIANAVLPQEKAIFLVLCGFFSFVLTAIPYFSRLGEPERYIEFIYPACWFIILGYFNEFYPYLSAYFLALYAMNLYVMRYRNSVAKTEITLEKSLAHLNLNKEDRILPLYLPDKYDLLLTSQSKIFSDFLINGDTSLLENGHPKYTVHLNYVLPTKLMHICEQFKINYLFYNKIYLDYVKKKYGIIYDFSKFKITYEDENYIVYKI